MRPIATIAYLAAILTTHASQAASFQSLYSFSGSGDGANPYGKLVVDASGILYGVTLTGGTGSRGTLYRFDPVAKMKQVLYSFSGGADGGNPQAALVSDGHGNLYGATPQGASTAHCNLGCGTLFRFNLKSGKLTTLYSFNGTADGAEPLSPLTLSKGVLYGVTNLAGTGANCGSSGCGTLFSFTLKTNTLTTTRELVPADGLDDEAAFITPKASPFINTSGESGPHGSGVVFAFDPASNAYAVLHAFDYHVDGFGPYADGGGGPKQGVLYGTTRAGGPTTSVAGTVFKMDMSTGDVTTLYSFLGHDDGDSPAYGVTFGPKERLYGVTEQGGDSGAGTLFQVDPKTGKYQMVHDFAISDGSQPSGPLLPAPDGHLYGVTSGGGRGDGTIFEYTP